MSIPIFWRIMSGYFVILLLAVGLSAYSIVQLGALSATARAALDSDNRMMAYQETLTDAFLSEVRYAGKFLITRAAANHEEFRQFKEDFKRYMSELTSLAATVEIKRRLLKIDELHLRYHELFDQEVRYTKAGQSYAHSRYQQEREKILDAGLRELEGLKAELNRNLHDKLERMEDAASSGRAISIASTLVLLGLGVGLSLGISKSITTPLSHLTRSVGQESEPILDAASDLSRIPEIRQLSDTVLQERWKLHELARSHAQFVDNVAEQLAAPLMAVKQRLNQVRQHITGMVPQNQRASLDIIIKEADRLIEHCSRLQSSPADTIQRRTNFQTPISIANSSMASQSVGRAFETASEYARPKASSSNARLHSTLKETVHRVRSLFGWPWLAVSQSINTLRDGKVKKQ